MEGGKQIDYLVSKDEVQWWESIWKFLVKILDRDWDRQSILVTSCHDPAGIVLGLKHEKDNDTV